MPEIPWRKICCPVDLSEESRAALRVAADLCRRFGATLTLMHVRDGSSADEDLSPLKREAEAAGAPRVASEEAGGDPQEAIAAFADEGGFDLVVMGTHGRTGRQRSLVGSVAETTVRKARCPVMVVHADWAAASA